MTDRPKVQSESDLHSSMYAKEILGGTARGGAVGAALGALLKHTGHGVGPGAVGTAGAILGGIHGGLRGRERSLRDAVTQQRMHQRAEARKKPREETKEAMTPYESIRWAAFSDELTKQSNLGNMVGSLGAGIMRTGTNLARSWSPEAGKTVAGWIGSGTKALGGQTLKRTVGGAALAGGGLLGAGMVAGRATS